MIVALIWFAALGACGGVLNATLAGQIQPLLWSTRHETNATRAPSLGLVGSAILGAVAVLGGSLVTGACALRAGAEPPSLAVASIAYFTCGFAAARWAGLERSQRLLRQAICIAAGAPAAHPDTIVMLRHASADEIYDAVADLMPPRASRP